MEAENNTTIESRLKDIMQITPKGLNHTSMNQIMKRHHSDTSRIPILITSDTSRRKPGRSIM